MQLSSFHVNYHSVGLVGGLLVFTLLLVIPSFGAMDYGSYGAVSDHLPEDTIESVSSGFGEVTKSTFPEFLEFAKTLEVSTSKRSSEMISAETYRSLQSASAYNAPVTLYDLIKAQSVSQMRVLALALLMAIWWITEAIPVSATALAPALLLPFLKVCNYRYSVFPGYFPAFEQYSHYLIFLFLGGFVIAAAMRKWGLDKRISLTILSIFGTRPSNVLLGFMVATAFLSMWISNTATAAMMMPVALAVLSQAGVTPGKSSFGLSLMLGIAYAASIGGIGTLIGTPPNGIAVGFISQFLGRDISFASWMKIGLPMVVVSIPIAWRFLLWRCPSEIKQIAGGKDLIRKNISRLGPLSIGEKNTLGVFVFTAIAWATRTSIVIGDTTLFHGWSTWAGGFLSNVHDSTIAVLAILLLFLLPTSVRRREFTMDWETAEKYVPWGTLILFGGGLTLGKAIANTGLASWVASYLESFASLHMIVLLFMIAFVSMLLSEVTSNTASTSMLMPVMFSLGVVMGVDSMAFMITSAVATSLVFILPVATPPNAIVYGTGYVKMESMVKHGFLLDFILLFVWVIVMYFVIAGLFGIVSLS